MSRFTQDFIIARLSAGMLLACLSGCGGGGDNGGNGVPRANPLTLAVTEDTPVQGAFDGYDPDGNALTASIGSAPTKGDVTISSSNPLAFTYTPRANQNGTDTFTYTVSDGKATSSAASVSVTIASVNDLPVIAASMTTNEDSAVTATLITDVDTPIRESTIPTPPAHGTLVEDTATPGRYTYSPNPNFNGTDSFVLRASDGPVQQTVAVTVNPVPDPPTANRDEFYTALNTPAILDPMANDTLVDSGPFTVTVTNAPGSGAATVNANGTIQYTPANSFTGFTSLRYRVANASGDFSENTVTIGVGQHWGTVFQEAPNDLTPRQLYFADGTQRFLVNGPMGPTERLVRVVAAKTAPIVFYSTHDPAITRLYRVDLADPGNATEIDPPGAAPGIEGFAINDDGSKVVYSLGGQLKIAEIAGAVTTHVLDTGATTAQFLNPSGSRAFYAKGGSTPAIYVVNTAGAPAPTKITADSPAGTEIAILDAGEDDRLAYSSVAGSTKRALKVDPASPLTESLLFSGEILGPNTFGRAAGSSVFYTMSVHDVPNNTDHADIYSFDVRHPGFVSSLTDAQDRGQIFSYAMTEDAKRFYYTRSQSDGMASRSTLYSVDVSNPSVATVVANHPETSFGVESVALEPNGNSLVYATSHLNNLGTSEYSKVYFLDLSTPGANPVELHAFARAGGQLLAMAPDGSIAIALGNDTLPATSFRSDLYVMRLQGLNQDIKVSVGLAFAPILSLSP